MGGAAGERVAAGGTAVAVTPVPSWRVALNPPIYLVSVLPGLGVALLAAGPPQAPLRLTLATLAVVLLQHAINLFNDAADWRLGADVEKYDSWVRVHGDRPGGAVVHGVISLLAGGLLGLAVLVAGGQLAVLWVAVPLLGLGYLYNAGPRPLSYTHLGEWVTGICYGPGVFGCLWWVAGMGMAAGLWAGIVAFAALAVALLLSHQPPQIETDRHAGKLSFAVRYGAERTVQVARGLFAVFALAGATGILLGRDDLARLPTALLAVLVALAIARGAAVNPRRILLAAGGLIGVGLLLQLGERLVYA